MTGVDSEEHIGTKLLQKKLAVFVSGGGSNFRSIYEACVRGLVPGDVVALVTNNRGDLDLNVNVSGIVSICDILL